MSTATRMPPNPIYVFFSSFGMKLRQDGEDFRSQCPYCLKEDHFGITKNEGVYNCLRCGKSGNRYTFLTDFHAECLGSTADGDYDNLAENRGLKKETLQVAKLAKSILNDNWLIPSYNQESKIVNLYQAVPYEKKTPPENKPALQGANGTHRGPLRADGKRFPPLRKRSPVGNPPGLPLHRRSNTGFEIKSAPSPCSQQLYGAELITTQPTLIVAEGHWDRLALWEIFAHLHIQSGTWFNDWKFLARGEPEYDGGIFEQIGIVAVPGANQFKPDWAKIFRNRHVILAYDNDIDKVICPTCRGRDGYKAHPRTGPCPLCGGVATTGTIINPGRDGILKVQEELDELGIIPMSLQYIAWRQGDPKDMRDVLCS